MLTFAHPKVSPVLQHSEYTGRVMACCLNKCLHAKSRYRPGRTATRFVLAGYRVKRNGRGEYGWWVVDLCNVCGGIDYNGTDTPDWKSYRRLPEWLLRRLVLAKLEVYHKW